MTPHQSPACGPSVDQEPEPSDAAPGPIARSGWSDAAVETLRALWADPDLSAAVIARRLGVTRNAVLGKVHRLGLSNRGRGARTPRPRPAHRSRPRPQRSSALPQAAHRPAPAVRTFPDRPTEPGPGLVERLEDLTVATCHWPIGDPKSQAFRFCGRRAWATPYCEAHCRVAFQPRLGQGAARR